MTLELFFLKLEQLIKFFAAYIITLYCARLHEKGC